MCARRIAGVHTAHVAHWRRQEAKLHDSRGNLAHDWHAACGNPALALCFPHLASARHVEVVQVRRHSFAAACVEACVPVLACLCACVRACVREYTHAVPRYPQPPGTLMFVPCGWYHQARACAGTPAPAATRCAHHHGVARRCAT